MNDEIVVKQGEPIPFVRAESDPNFVKHVRCEGSIFHVPFWTNKGRQCSEPKCICNKGK